MDPRLGLSVDPRLGLSEGPPCDSYIEFDEHPRHGLTILDTGCSSRGALQSPCRNFAALSESSAPTVGEASCADLRLKPRRSLAMKLLILGDPSYWWPRPLKLQ